MSEKQQRQTRLRVTAFIRLFIFFDGNDVLRALHVTPIHCSIGSFTDMVNPVIVLQSLGVQIEMRNCLQEVVTLWQLYYRDLAMGSIQS